MKWEHELSSSVLFTTVEWASMSELYYTAPTDEVFNEVKDAAITLWMTYDDTYGYATEKAECIKHLANVSDNLMYIVGMFDLPNQGRLAAELGEEARKAIRDRMIEGGAPESLIAF